jgi:hypothetical protein
MSKIDSITVSNLNNGDYSQYMEDLIKVGNETQLPAVTTALQELVTLQLQAKDSFMKENLTEETAQVVSLDLKRDRAFVKLKKMAEAYEYDDQFPENSAAAKRILKIIATYGGAKLTKQDFNKETAYINSLVDALRKQALLDINLLRLLIDLDYLQICNTQFEVLYNKRSEVATGLNDIIPYRKLRKLMNVAYRNYRSDIESMQRTRVEIAPQIEKLISRMNVDINTYKIRLAKTKTNNAKK